MPSLYNYLNYREFLRDYFIEQKPMLDKALIFFAFAIIPLQRDSATSIYFIQHGCNYI